MAASTLGLLAGRAERTPSALTFSRLTRDERPRSVGTDGLLYGADGNVAFRTDDAFATTPETGNDFGTDSLYWITRVREGYVAVTTDDGADTGKLWFSSSWATGWSAVQAIRSTNFIAISKPVLGSGGGTRLLVGEYGSGAKERVLWFTEDGGQTWTAIRTGTITNAAHNLHWHSACYDPDRNRIWACHGDGDNAWLGYSDNGGSSWTDLTPVGQYLQPTMLEHLRHRIAAGPDKGQAVGVSQIALDGTYDGMVRTALSDVAASQQFPIGVRGGGEGRLYVTIPPNGSGTDRLFILATGDYGLTWHTLEDRTLDGAVFSQGIVGPDLNGKLYLPGTVSGTSVIDVADEPTWSA